MSTMKHDSILPDIDILAPGIYWAQGLPHKLSVQFHTACFTWGIYTREHFSLINQGEDRLCLTTNGQRTAVDKEDPIIDQYMEDINIYTKRYNCTPKTLISIMKDRLLKALRNKSAIKTIKGQWAASLAPNEIMYIKTNSDSPRSSTLN